MKSAATKRSSKRMWCYIAGGVFLALAIYLIVQGIRCGIAVRESKDRLAAYKAKTAALSYGDMTRLMIPVKTFVPIIGSSRPHGSDT